MSLPTVVRLAYSDTPGAGTSTTMPVPVAQPIGTWMAVYVSSSGGGSTLGVTDTAGGNTWVQRGYASNGSSPSAVVAIFVCQLATALTTSHNITATSTAGSGCGDIMLLKIVPDVGATLAFHNTSAGTGTGTAPAVASYTPGSNSVTLVALTVSTATLNTSTTAGAGFTKLAGGDAHVQTRSVVGQYGFPTAATTTPMTSTNNPWAITAVTMTQTPAVVATNGIEFTGAVSSGTASKTRVMPVTAAVPIGAKAVIAVEVPGSSANTSAGTTVTDTKGNVWNKREFIVQTTAPANGQLFILDCDVTVALTTSDTVTIVVDNTGATTWAWEGIYFASGVSAFDVGAVNAGATNNTLDSGTTAAAAQNTQLVCAAWVFSGTGITLTGLPSEYTQMPIRTTVGTVRNLVLVWGYVNASGTRHITAGMGSSHAWAGAIVAYDSIAPAPADTYLFLPDALGTGFLNSELIMAVGSGWDS